MVIPVKVQEHPLKAEIKKYRLSYWWLRKALGGYPSEASLCRIFKGIDPMPQEVETGISQILAEIRQQQQAAR